MASGKNLFTTRQLLFKDFVIGTLIYAVVLSFLSDYASVVYADTFSTIFMASAVLEALTLLTLALKDRVVGFLKLRDHPSTTFLIVFGVWLILFLSKFVFIWVIDLIFSGAIEINGFFGVLLVVLSVTIIQKLADLTFIRLGDTR